MDGVLVRQGGEFLVRKVVGDEGDVCGDGVGGIFLMLEEGEGGPFGMLLPEVQDGFGAF